MADRPTSGRIPSRAELEAQRELLREAIADLPTAANPDRAASEVLRALDAYIDAARVGGLAPREEPVTDFDRRIQDDIRWTTWLVLAGAILATIVVAIVLSGGWWAGVAIVAIWAIALFALTQT
jgi:hypothetical protein